MPWSIGSKKEGCDQSYTFIGSFFAVEWHCASKLDPNFEETFVSVTESRTSLSLSMIVTETWNLYTFAFMHHYQKQCIC